MTAPVIQEIMDKRPFFFRGLCRVLNAPVTKDKVVNLIKAGTFNKIENADRRTILTKFIQSTADQKKVTMS